MVVMTAKMNKKHILLALAAIAALIILIVSISGRGKTESPAGEPVNLSTNDGRIAYLTGFGWEVATSPVETQQVRIPTELSEVYERYNALQISQGFDLTNYAGKIATRYVYQIENYPNATEPVYATLLIYKNQVIGGDVTDTSANGVVQGLKAR